MSDIWHGIVAVFGEPVIDTLKILPLLFIAYLLMELLEKKASAKMENTLGKIGKAGPVVGSLLGCVPQCGFSGASANLYTAGIITEGTLIAVFLSTSDEAIVLMLSSLAPVKTIGKLILVKVLIGVVAGYLIDFINRKRKIAKIPVDMCRDCGCDENEGIFKPALKHTVKIGVFIFIVNFVLFNIASVLGEDFINSILLSGSFFQPFITGLVGLIPNCAVSAAITELYTCGTLSFGSAVAGLCSGAGVGLAVLFKANPIKRENLRIVWTLYIIAVISGIVLNILGI
ncbi:MAG: arsenic efflux protein [Clostridia bacterium]|nr:arsenic efflux protein [Clostridia bacterium]